MNKLQLRQGNDESLTITFTDENGAAIDLTGCTVFFTVKPGPHLEDTDTTDAQAKITKTITSIPNPTLGIVNIPLTSVQTNIPVGSYYYDIRIKYSDGKLSNSDVGACDVIKTVTKRTS